MKLSLPARAGLASASGLLASLSFPSWAVPSFAPWTGWIAWFSLVPLMMAAAGAGLRAGAFAGWIGGTVFFASTLYWLAGIAELGPFGPAAWLLAAAALGLYWAVFAAAVSRAGARGAVAVAPAAWVLLEFVRETLFTGFPWTPLGASQWAWPAVFLSARIYGVAGVSLLVVAVNVALWAAAGRALRAGPAPRPRDAGLVAAILIGAALLLSLGAERRIAADVAAGRRTRVAALQGSFTEREKWELPLEVLLGRFEELAGRAAAGRPEVMVWPETATASVVGDDRRLGARMARIAARAGAPQVVGALVLGASGRLQNGALVVTGEGIRGRYSKTHLVPFGEYVPRWFGPFRKLTQGLTEGLADLEAGERIVPLETASGLRIGAAVCYEAIFPAHARELARNGAEVFANVTNDAWYGRTAATYQHALGPIARSVECGRFTVRCANTGASLIADPRGRVSGELPLFEPGIVEGEVVALSGFTCYVSWGRAATAAWTAFAVLLGLARPFRLRRARRAAETREGGGTP